MLSAFKYRIYPKDEQEMRLNRSLLSLCTLYNNLKAEEMRRYREEHKSTSQTKFRALALDARRHDDELRETHSQVVQNVGGGSSPAEQGPLPSLREMASPSKEARSLPLQG